MKRRYLTPEEVAELAELLDDWPTRVGLVDEVLDAAEAHRGMTLLLGPDSAPGRRSPS